MNKRSKIIIILISWMLVVYVLYRFGLLTTNFTKIHEIIGNNPIKMRYLFVFLSTARIMLLIPQTLFIIFGGIMFESCEGFFLSVLSLVISQSIMYFIGRFFQKQLLGDTFFKKNEQNINILKKHGYKILALGIACPATPSDLMTVMAACIKLNYKKCIAVILMADVPMIFLYGFLGSGFEKTVVFKVIAIIGISFVSYYTFYIWNRIRKS